MQTVVGLYKTVADANKVKQALLSEGYSGGDVTVIDQSESGSTGSSYGTGAGSGVTGLTGSNQGITEGTTGSEYRSAGSGSTEDSVGSKIKRFFQGLGGHDEHTHKAYTEGVSRGGALVAVKVSNDDEADRAAAVLQAHGASDIEGGSGAGYESNRGYAASDTGTRGTTTGEQVIPVVAEELVVGKRQVDRGGVRVFSHVVSENVSENVNLHDERVMVDRHAVNRAATEADFVDAGPIEVRAMGEEAIVGKTGRVVEEVRVGKTGSDRTETVSDSVRHTEVDVEPMEADTTTTSATRSKY